MAISLDDLKKISPKRKALILSLVFLLLGYLYYYFLFQAMYEKKAGLDTRLSGIKQQITAKQLIVKEIQKSKKELLVMQENLKLALTKLPDQKEIPGLLSSLARAGRAAGLDFIQFEPQVPAKPAGDKKDKKKAGSKPTGKGAASSAQEAETFYETIPIKVVVRGVFHDTVSFLDQVANLPRIVNVADVTMVVDKDAKDDGSSLTTSCTMKTYVFVEKTDAKK